jgi:glutathione S-transferase
LVQEPWFLEINPNGRIPALTDTFTDGSPIRLFESGSIMQYLVDRYDTEHKVSYPHGSREYWEVNNWVRTYFMHSTGHEYGWLTGCWAVAVLADGRSGTDARVCFPIY